MEGEPQVRARQCCHQVCNSSIPHQGEWSRSGDSSQAQPHSSGCQLNLWGQSWRSGWEVILQSVPHLDQEGRWLARACLEHSLCKGQEQEPERARA